VRAECRKRETLLDPAALGLQGPQGPKGDPGDPASLPPSEAWHDVGLTVGEPQFGSNWANNDGTRPVGFYKDPLGIVRLKGGALPTMVGSARIFTLPAGYRPSVNLTMTGLGCGTGAVFVGTNGDVSAGFSSGVCTLDGLSFRGD
jgi:hypothetical protein